VKRALTLLVVGLLALPLPVAAAQERTATPSAEELWRSYPLEASPAPTASPQPAAPPARSTPVLPLALLGVLIGLGALALPQLRRRRASGDEALAPPDPHRAWTAAIEWHEAEGEGSFRVLVRRFPADPGSVIAESPPVAWPPAGPAAVQALTAAAARLEVALLASGWRALARGDEWYSKRFAWEPPGARRQARPRGRAPAPAR
jgi:hypothetical protein